MAGTDSRQPSLGHGPTVILIEPQLGENIGTAARAMLNCGLTDLRLVRPRDGWPNEAAMRAASGADRVIDGAQLFPSTEAAIADLNRVWATSARPRDMVKPVVAPRVAASQMATAMGEGARCGILFGPERAGLVNDDIALADTILEIPLNPAFRSLNLAQAVLLVGWEWFAREDAPPLPSLRDADRGSGAVAQANSVPANKDVLVNLFAHLERALDDSGFLALPDKRPSMVRNIRNMFQRAMLTEQEVRTFHGIVTALSGRKRK